MLSIFVPALNEEKNIGPTIEMLLGAAEKAGGFPIEILAANDGSTDRTGEIIEEFAKCDPRVRPIHHGRNLGIGHGFKEALSMANYPKIMIVPGDNDMPEDTLLALMANCDRVDIVIAYWLNREERGRFRNILSTLFSSIYMLSFDIFIQYLNGPAIYPTEKVRQLSIRSERFSICAEVTIKLLRSGCTFSEVSGYMATGIEGSASLRLHNLAEVVSTYMNLLYEIHIAKRETFCHRPKRARIGAATEHDTASQVLNGGKLRAVS